MSDLTGIKEHEAAALLPAMSDAEFAALVDDIRENGLREPIVLHEGKILDGRHRWRACEQLGVEPLTTEWDGKGSPEAFVASMNLHRRHLTESQRAMVAARMATLKVGRPRAIDRENETVADATIPISVSQAATLMSVGRATVQDAKTVLTAGTDDEIAAVDKGEVGARTIADQIRKGVSAKDRATALSRPVMEKGKNPDRVQRMQVKGKIYSQLRDAIIALSTLPLPSEVAAVARSFDRRHGKIKEQFDRALTWLMEFSDEWERQGAAGQAEGADEGAGDHHADAGIGDGAIGAEQPEQAA